jgi:RNA polymerase sigma-70 factor, ECF subfamily
MPDPGRPADCPILPVEELMTRVQGGDMEAFRELTRLYQKKVFRVVSGYQRNHEDALEVVQDTFLKLFVSRSTWERKTSFSAWLYRIAINASIDRFRRTGDRKTEPLEGIMESSLHRSASMVTAADPLVSMRQSERRRLIEAAVSRLPDRQRQIVSLRYFAEMQLEEIAESLSCPLGTVKSNLHKAIIALRGLLNRQKEVLSHD